MSGAVQEVGVALLGLGTVGGAVAQAIANEADAIERASGIRLKLVGGAVRNVDAAVERTGLDRALVTTDGVALIDDPATQIVVEVLGGEQPAAVLMQRALAA